MTSPTPEPSPDAPVYDAFISHSPEDTHWVQEWLLPRLEAAGLRVAVGFRDFVVGRPRLENIEDFISRSRRTIAVITPAWLESDWNNFEALLLRTRDPAARRRLLLPVILRPTPLPELLNSLEPVDLSQESHWERELTRLVRDIQDTLPVPPPWQQPGGLGDWNGWQRWLWRYRRSVARAFLATLVLWLGVAHFLALPPLQPRPGWQALSPRLPQAWHLARAGPVLLVSTATDDQMGCQGVGLWRSPHRGKSWERVFPPLEFTHPDLGCVLAAITAFAVDPQDPAHIWAATTDVGLLTSRDAGRTWQLQGGESLPRRLRTVAVHPTDPARLWVLSQAGRLYRSADGGDHWQPVGGTEPCSDDAALLPDVSWQALAVAERALLLAGVDRDSALHPQGGLYRSQDDGRCWRMLASSRGRYGYPRLFPLGPEAEEILVLAFDHAAAEGLDPYGLWRATASQGLVGQLWSSRAAVGDVWLDRFQPQVWYAVTDLGRVVRGSTTGGPVVDLPRVTRCLLPPTCETDLAGDESPGPTLLLAGERVYRADQVAWYRALWP